MAETDDKQNKRPDKAAPQSEQRPAGDGKPTRVGFKILPDGRKVRIAKRSGAEIDG